MSIQDLGSLGELVAAVATVITLVYLAIRIRQNTASAGTATCQNIVSSGLELGHTLGRDESFADTFARGARSPGSPSPAESVCLYSHITVMFRCYELVFHQYEHGATDKAVWEGWRLNMQRFLRLAAYREVWQRTRDEWSPVFREVADKLCEKGAARETQRDG